MNEPVKLGDLIPEGTPGRSQLLDKFSSVGDLAKSYVELESTVGSRAKIPTAESDPDEIAAFRSKRGVPDSPEGYKLPEDASEFVQAARNAAHDAGMAPFEWDGMVESLQTFESDKAETTRKADEDRVNAWKAATQDVHGEKGVAAAKRFLTEVVKDDSDMAKFLEESGLVHNPDFVGFCAESQKKLGGDFFPTKGDTVTTDETDKTARAQKAAKRIHEIHATEAFNTRNHPERTVLEAEEMALMNEIADLGFESLQAVPMADDPDRFLKPLEQSS